jgi:hypothetical protein
MFMMFFVLPASIVTLSILKCGFLKPLWKRAQRAAEKDNRAQRLVGDRDSFELKLPPAGAAGPAEPSILNDSYRAGSTMKPGNNRTFVEHSDVSSSQEERSAIKVQFKQKVMAPKDPHLMHYDSNQPPQKSADEP